MAAHGPTTNPMTAEEAVDWLREVDGELYRTRPNRRGREAWVAVVRAPDAPAPAPGRAKGRLIVALGETLQEAATAAASEWREVFRGVGPLH
ncbi:MAG: hypothetical protein ACQGVC_00065 [Myxococcota bacterium]